MLVQLFRSSSRRTLLLSTKDFDGAIYAYSPASQDREHNLHMKLIHAHMPLPSRNDNTRNLTCSSFQLLMFVGCSQQLTLASPCPTAHADRGDQDVLLQSIEPFTQVELIVPSYAISSRPTRRCESSLLLSAYVRRCQARCQWC